MPGLVQGFHPAAAAGAGMLVDIILVLRPDLAQPGCHGQTRSGKICQIYIYGKIQVYICTCPTAQNRTAGGGVIDGYIARKAGLAFSSCGKLAYLLSPHFPLFHK